jgi:hypothetical protein
MTQVFFHCSTDGLLAHSHRVDVEAISETPDLATRFVRSLIATPSDEDWRSWILRVSDARGEVFLVVPFASLLGKPH